MNTVLKFQKGKTVNKKTTSSRKRVEPPSFLKILPNWFTNASKRAAFNENPAVMTASGWTAHPDGSTKLDAFNTPERNALANKLAQIGIMGATDIAMGALAGAAAARGGSSIISKMLSRVRGARSPKPTSNVPAVRPTTAVSTSRVTPNVPAVRTSKPPVGGQSSIVRVVSSSPNVGKAASAGSKYSKMTGILGSAAILPIVFGTDSNTVGDNKTSKSSATQLLTPVNLPSEYGPTLEELTPELGEVKGLDYVSVGDPVAKLSQIPYSQGVTTSDTNVETPYLADSVVKTPYLGEAFTREWIRSQRPLYSNVDELFDYVNTYKDSRESLLIRNTLGDTFTYGQFKNLMKDSGIRGNLGRRDSRRLADYLNSLSYKNGGLLSKNPILRFKLKRGGKFFKY